MRSSNKTVLGCEGLIAQNPAWLRSARIGLLSNQASVNGKLEPVSLFFKRSGVNLTRLFSPQHGYDGDKQANMIESGHSWDTDLELPVYSLYGEHRKPTAEMLQDMDILLIDLQDVGTRVYTFATTMGLCMEAAADAGIEVLVLDRPNPIAGCMEGNVLNPEYRSFVGRYPVPMRHGLTLGEMARFIRNECGVECNLRIFPMQGWSRDMQYPDTGLQWAFPSPNMPNYEAALLYPGMVLLEGTNISEGRGTTLPFQVFGAPFLDRRSLLESIDKESISGLVFRPVSFEPTFDKWKGELCRGFQIHIEEPGRVKPYLMALSLLQALGRVLGDSFSWLPPPYEYEREKLPIDILIGDGEIRRQLEVGAAPLEMESAWSDSLNTYKNLAEKSLIYR